MKPSTTLDAAPHRAVYDAVQIEGPAPLEQSWAFGEAIAAVSRNAVRRMIVEIDGVPAATIQAAERALPGGLRLVRLTRGPVAPGAADAARIAAAVRLAWPRRSRNLLFWMPDVDAEAAAPLLRPLGKRPMTSGYTTAWLDLSPEPDALRRGLRGNWRNALARAEDDPPPLRLSWRPRDVEPFIRAYLADRRAQRYGGPSEGLVRALAVAFGRDVFLMRALAGGETVAASLFLRHGRSATYFLSWTTPAGREANAAHLLLWDGLLRLREAGVRWLDLGGLDARAPGVARFKLGLGAEPVVRAGTWF